MIHPLTNVVKSQAEGQPRGIYSVCSANRFAIEAAMLQATHDDSLLLIEATSNQVDQFGGYTGLTPSQFVTYVGEIARSMDYSDEKLLLGGDHLGPNRWQWENADKAMSRARDQIRAYVLAGFKKIHLDTSMRLGDDPGDADTPSAPGTIAERAADLASTAEEAYSECTMDDSPLYYVIGTDVPTPGGAQKGSGQFHVTSSQEAQRTIELHRSAFAERGLDAAWERVIGVVVQPGVEFGNNTVHEYQSEKAWDLIQLIQGIDQLVYEAHSTDYQTGEALRQMVKDQFAILKVGPWLTFALREALFALAQIESEWLSDQKSTSLSNLLEVIEVEMVKNPEHWSSHYLGDEHQQQYARKYSYSDRVRYYWPVPEVARAVTQLIDNLDKEPPPLTLISQYLPVQYHAIREGRQNTTPRDLIRAKIMEVTAIYAQACGYS